MKQIYTTQAQVRRAFWEDHPNLEGREGSRKLQNKCSTDTRSAFVDFVDTLHRQGFISDALAQRVTL